MNKLRLTSLIAAAAFGWASTQAAQADPVPPPLKAPVLFTYSPGLNCQGGKRTDPLSVWFTGPGLISTGGQPQTAAQVIARLNRKYFGWGDSIGGSIQQTHATVTTSPSFSTSGCAGQRASQGRTWGPPTAGNDYTKKRHVRLFDVTFDNAARVASDPHLEHSVRCGSGSGSKSDSVFEDVDHTDGFTSAARSLARGYRGRPGVTISRPDPYKPPMRTPYPTSFYQCQQTNGSRDIVDWSGDLYYINIGP